MTDLALDLHLGGRAAKALTAEITRQLTASDLALLSTERGIQPTHVQRLSDRHHGLARCVATGMSDTEAALCMGYTTSRISVLRGDPAFEELVTFYRGTKAEAVQDLAGKMASIALDTVTILHERLETAPETFSTGELHEQLKLTADRTGFGPRATTVNVNVNLGDRLRAARERAAGSVLPDALSSQQERASLGHEAGPPIIEGTVNKDPSL